MSPSTVLEACRIAAECFRNYERMHNAKGATEKAERNAEMAVMLEAALAAGRWKAIAEAPKDGTSVLIYGPAVQLPYDPGPPLMTIAWWEPKHVTEWFREDRYGNQIERKHPKYIGAWVDGVTTDHGERDVTYDPTHWMPLPLPPAKEDAPWDGCRRCSAGPPTPIFDDGLCEECSDETSEAAEHNA